MAPDIRAIRAAIASGEFEKAGDCWKEYVAELEKELRRGDLTSAKLEEARELVEWARITVRCARGHLQERLQGLQVAEAYSGKPAPEAPPILQTRL